MTTTELEGIQFPADPTGRRSTTATNKAIYSAALEGVDSRAAQAIRDERAWRQRYPAHVRALTTAGIARPEHALAIAQAGLAEAWRQFVFIRDGQAMSFAEAIDHPRPDALHTAEICGRGGPEIVPWSVPYRGQRLRGDALRAQLSRWEQADILEPSHAEALRQALDHPEWFDLSARWCCWARHRKPARLSRWRAGAPISSRSICRARPYGKRSSR